MRRKIKEFFLLFLIVFAIRVIPASIGEFLSPDACLYLNMGKNFFEQGKFVITYNFYHFWKDPSYSAIPFLFSLYSLLAGFVFFLLHTIKAVTFLNVFISYLNLLFIFYLLSFFSLSKKTRYFVCVLISLNYTFFYTSLFPWTEQMHLLFLLLSFFILLKSSPQDYFSSLLIGIIMGVATLVRVANIFNIFGYLLIFLFLFPQRIKNLFLFLTGVALVILPYELLCFFKYKVFYPQYLEVTKVYGQARIYGGYYKDSLPVLNATLKITPLGFLYIFFSTSLPKIREFFAILYDYLGGFLWLAGVGMYELFRERKPFYSPILSFFIIGVVNIFFYSFSVWWDPDLEYYRYVLIPYICFFIVSVILIDKVLSINSRTKNIFLIVLFFFIFLKSGYHRLQTNYRYLTDARKIVEKNSRRRRMLSWLNQHTNFLDVVATPEFYHAFPLDCVIVAFPQRRVMTKENMNKFLEIYRPKYIWLKKEEEKIFLPFLSKYEKENLPPSLYSFYSVFRRKDSLY